MSTTAKTTDTVIVGAGQAGLALSYYLTRSGQEHVLLERGRVGERWRSERWDSLHLLSPNWLNELPGGRLHRDPDGFLGRAEFVDYLAGYAASFQAPVLEGVSVLEVAQRRDGFAVLTDAGRWCSRNVVVATGFADEPRVPAIAASAPTGLLQLHSSGYRRPTQLPPGGVLVVGAGPSGLQLAAELSRAGRDVIVAVGGHTRMPRRYRGKDAFHWFAVTGHLDETLVDLEGKRDTVGMRPQGLSGANGGEDLDLAVLAELGVTMTGRLRGFVGNHALVADDLQPTVEDANERMRRLLAEIDWYIEGLPHRERPNAQWIAPVTLPVQATTVDLQAANVSTLIWATGYRRSYPWLNVNVLDGNGEITHRRGVTPTSGLYALGLRFQHRRKSHFIGGVGADAHFIATQLHKHTHHTRASHRVRPEPSAS